MGLTFIRQSCSDEQKRQVPLRNFVACDDDGGQFGGQEVLHFVDDGNVSFSPGRADERRVPVQL